jgi:hypothetical protein
LYQGHRQLQIADKALTAKPKDRRPLNFSLSILLFLTIAASPALAEVEQCRFIQGKAEREACYPRQEAALAEKRKQAATREAKPAPTLEQMSREDAALKAQLRGICRGC